MFVLLISEAEQNENKRVYEEYISKEKGKT